MPYSSAVCCLTCFIFHMMLTLVVLDRLNTSDPRSVACMLSYHSLHWGKTLTILNTAKRVEYTSCSQDSARQTHECDMIYEGIL